MAKRRAGNDYAHRILAAIERSQKRSNTGPYPVDMGEIKRVGSDEDDIVISLTNSLIELEGDEVQWMIDEDKLREGDIVTVVFDKAGDPMVVAAVMEADLLAGLESPASTDPVTTHEHRVEAYVPTAPQSVFQMATGFDGVAVYVNGLRWTESIHYDVQSPHVSLATSVVASTVVEFDLRTDSSSG